MERKIKITCSLLIILGLLVFYIQPAQAGFFDWLKSLFTEEKIQEILPASIEPLATPEETLEIECPLCPECSIPKCEPEIITKEVPVEKIVTKEVIKEVPIEKIVYKDNPDQAKIIQELKQEIEILEARIKELEQWLVKAQDNSVTVGTENNSSVELEIPQSTDVEQYYSVVEHFPRNCPGQGTIYQRGMFPNDIRFSTDSNCRHYKGNYDAYGWWGEGIIVAFENNWVIPLNWLLRKEYIPSSKKDLPRIRKVFECEFGLYLRDNGFIQEEYQGHREECETFLQLTAEKQFEFNQDYFEENNRSFFYVPSSY